MSTDTKAYLGDGLYAEFDGWQFRLYAERDHGVHEVFLAPTVLEAFLAFINRAHAAASETIDSGGDFNAM